MTPASAPAPSIRRAPQLDFGFTMMIDVFPGEGFASVPAPA